jgi:phage gp29-like protein
MKKLWLNANESITIPSVSAIDLGETATRERSIDFTYMGSYLPNPDPILKKAGVDQTVYRELLTDPHVGAVASSRKAGVKSMQWEIEPGEAPAQVVDFIRGIFADHIDVPRTTSQILNAPLFGYQPFEAMWGRVGNLAITTDLVAKPSEWFVYSDKNELLFRTRNNWNGEPVGPRKFLVARHEDSYENPYGEPALSKAFWWVSFKKGGIKFWVTFAEKYGMPFAVGKLPSGRDEKHRRDLLAGMKKMVQDACAVINDDQSIELLEAAGKSASSDLFKSLCEYCDTQISKGIVGQTLTTEIGQTGGANAAAQTHKDVLDEITSGDSRIVEGIYDSLIRWNVEVNFAYTGKLPKFKLFYPEDLGRKADLSKKISDLGPRFTRAYFEEELNLKPDHFELPPAPSGDGDAAALGLPRTKPGGSPLPVKRAGASEFAAPTRGHRTLSPHAMTLHFAESPTNGLDRLDDVAAATTPEDLQGLLKPVWPIIESGGNAEAISDGLARAYADMNDTDFEAALTQALFIANLWGRMSVSTQGNG